MIIVALGLFVFFFWTFLSEESRAQAVPILLSSVATALLVEAISQLLKDRPTAKITDEIVDIARDNLHSATLAMVEQVRETSKTAEEQVCRIPHTMHIFEQRFLPTRVWEASDGDRTGFVETLHELITNSHNYRFRGLTGRDVQSRLANSKGILDVKLLVADPAVADHLFSGVMNVGSYPQYAALTEISPEDPAYASRVSTLVRQDVCVALVRLFHQRRRSLTIEIRFEEIDAVRLELFDDALVKAAWTPHASTHKYPETFLYSKGTVPHSEAWVTFDQAFGAVTDKKKKIKIVQSTTEAMFRQNLSTAGFTTQAIDCAFQATDQGTKR